MRRSKVKTSGGQRHVSRVMRVFERGRLRSSSGETVTNPKQAQVIAINEAKTGEKKGFKKRSWRGRSRLRPNL